MSAATNLPETLDSVAEWVETEIAPLLLYLVPSDTGAVKDIELEWAHPCVFQMFVPSAERLTSGEHQAPSIAVQFLGGDDTLDAGRVIRISLVLTIWSPGHFDEDGAFARSSDGWRDLYNGLGVIADTVGAAETIAGCAVDARRGVSYGLFEVDKEIPDLYPYWMGKVDFSLRKSPHAKDRFRKLL